MTETLAPQTQLPEFKDTPEDIAYFQTDLDTLQRMWQRLGHSYEFTAQLPQIVGYIPEEERDAFDNDHIITGDSNVLKQFPGTLSVINADLRIVLGREYDEFLDNTVFDSRKVYAGRRHREPSWHTDSSGKGRIPFSYVACDVFPTEFYDGQATMRVMPNGELSTNQESLSSNNVTPAPVFAIARLTPLTIHRSPILPEDMTRTFFRVRVE